MTFQTPIALYSDEHTTRLATTRQSAENTVKIHEDLERYRRIITDTQPEVLVESGTWQGGAAVWFARLGLDVITVDLKPYVTHENQVRGGESVTWLLGDSTSTRIVDRIQRLTTGRRTMVVLDSDHRADHVRREIELYTPLVSSGCYLVVEDGVVEWMLDETYEGPLHAIQTHLVDNPTWYRDLEIEKLHLVTMHLAGWWRKEDHVVED